MGPAQGGLLSALPHMSSAAKRFSSCVEDMKGDCFALPPRVVATFKPTTSGYDRSRTCLRHDQQLKHTYFIITKLGKSFSPDFDTITMPTPTWLIRAASISFRKASCPETSSPGHRVVATFRESSGLEDLTTEATFDFMQNVVERNGLVAKARK